jgi:deazaflavin-dependent oxidoreductase (nitroreductase family)
MMQTTMRQAAPAPKKLLTRWVLLVQNRAINRAVRLLLSVGLAPPTYALLETTGRKSRLPRQVPVANGLQGSTFWLIAGLGERAQYVRNIKTNPHVRVKARPVRFRDGLRMRWHSGTAHPMPEDDARGRHRQLGAGRPGYRLDGIALRALAGLEDGQMLTVRVDLESEPPTHLE